MRKNKTEFIRSLTDDELYKSISEQDSLLASLTKAQLERYKHRNSHYSLSNEQTTLEYFGAEHVFDPKNPQFSSIERAFNAYLFGKDLTNVSVLVEGSVPATTNNIEQDIRFTGERGFITHLARDKGVEVKCIEPDRVAEAVFLLEQFQPYEIEYYYYLRAIRDYFRLGRIQDETSFEDYSKQLLKKHKQLYGGLEEFSNFDFSLENIIKIHKDIIGSEFDPNARLDINPRNTNTVINYISKASSNFRDFFHVRAIEGLLNEGYILFIVNGYEHAIVQRPALETMFS